MTTGGLGMVLRLVMTVSRSIASTMMSWLLHLPVIVRLFVICGLLFVAAVLARHSGLSIADDLKSLASAGLVLTFLILIFALVLLGRWR
jgi:hypothetical protein